MRQHQVTVQYSLGPESCMLSSTLPTATASNPSQAPVTAMAKCEANSDSNIFLAYL